MVTVCWVQRPDRPEAGKSSEETKSATVKRKKKKKRKLAHVYIQNMSVEMTDVGHSWASPVASQRLSLKQNGNRGWPVFLRAGSGIAKWGTIAMCVAKLMKMDIKNKQTNNKNGV